MYSQLKKTVSATVVSVALATPLSMAGMVMTADAAFAKSSNAGGRSASNRSERGRIASTLKNLNAANAFKNGNVPAAVENAPDSNIGQIGSLQLAVADTVSAGETLAEAEQAVADLLAAVSAEYNEEGNLTIDEDAYTALVEGTDQEGTSFEDYLAGLEEAAGEASEAYLTAVSMEEEALFTASGGNDFDYYGGFESDTLVYLRGLLGFGS